MSNIMFRIPQKKTTSVDLYGPFRSYIASQYSEEEAWNHENDLQTLKKLRSDVEDPAKQRSPPGDRLNLLQFYFRVLCVIEIVFPISSAEDQVDVTFTWYDAFEEEQKRNFFRKGRQIQKASQQNIHLEKAAVLFNLGAVYSQIGQSCDRSTLKGRKVAQRAFESAAGAFAYLKENAAPKASEGGDSITVDVSVECADMLEKLMLAQAQECALENANAKESSWGAQAKIARQAAMYCEDALAALSKPILIRHVPKHWKRRVQLKAAFFNAEACWKRGSELYKEREVGEAIARLTSGINTLKKAKKSTEGAPSQLLDTIKNLKQNISSELDKAVKKNEVYGESVPLLDSLPPLPSFSMVEPMEMNDILDASKEKIFASLVQVESAKERSRYTEMVDEIIRTQAEKSGQLEEDIRRKLDDMGLPGSIEALEERFTVPADLEQELEAARSIGGRAGLEAKLQKLLDLTQASLQLQKKELLQKRVKEDAQFRDRPGTRGARSKSSTLKKDLQDGENGFAADLRRATKSYADIKRSVNNHSALMSILDHPPIESAFPNLGALKKSLKQLHTPGSQSARLQEELKVMNGKDDVLPKGIQEDLFRKKIGEYKRTSEENIKAKAQLLLKIQEQNDQFFSDLEDYEASCQKCYKQIRAAIAKYREIKEKIDDALKPYIDLQDSVTNKKQQCDKFVMTRNNQRRETIGSETDVYGQAASSSVAGANLEEAIRQIWDIGGGRWDMDTVVLALDVAGNDRERAVGYLLSGLPEQAEVPPATRVPPCARAVPPAQPARPAQFAPGQLASTMPQGVTVLPKEREAIERLEVMGFDRARVLEAYIACNKNEEQAANLLLDEAED